MNKVFVLAAALLAWTGAHAAETPPKPQRVMSLNVCTDQLVLQLLPKERISSIYYLSRTSGYTYLTAQALAVPVSYGTPEEVLRDNPDLVIAGSLSTPAVRALLKRVNVPLVEVPAANSFVEIRAVTRMVAHAVGEDDAGEALVARMDATLAELAASTPERRIVVAAWDGAGNVPAKGTLFDEILTVAGGINVVAGIETNIVYGRYNAFDLEQLVAKAPDVIAYGASRLGKPTLASQQLQHPVVRKLYAGRAITYPETLYNCGLPQSADAARDLRAAMLKAVSGTASMP